MASQLSFFVCKTGDILDCSCWSLRSTAQIQTFTSLPYTLEYCKLSTIHLFTHGFWGVIHTYLYLQVLQIKQIRKHSSTKIPPRLTSREVTTIHPNTLCSPKNWKKKYTTIKNSNYIWNSLCKNINIIYAAMHVNNIHWNMSFPTQRGTAGKHHPTSDAPEGANAFGLRVRGRRPGWWWRFFSGVSKS